jgi:hypothetical protein
LRLEVETKDQLRQSQDDMKMLNISLETRDEQIASLFNKLKMRELEILKQTEVKSFMQEKGNELEAKIRSLSNQLIEVGQDRR